MKIFGIFILLSVFSTNAFSILNDVWEESIALSSITCKTETYDPKLSRILNNYKSTKIEIHGTSFELKLNECLILSQLIARCQKAIDVKFRFSNQTSIKTGENYYHAYISGNFNTLDALQNCDMVKLNGTEKEDEVRDLSEMEKTLKMITSARKEK
jgi:hypothetical protein